MKKHAIWLVISLMTLALLGLSTFQYYWISDVIKQNQQRFIGDVYASLNYVASRLESLEMRQIALSGYFSYTEKIDTSNVFSPNVDSSFPLFLDSMYFPNERKSANDPPKDLRGSWLAQQANGEVTNGQSERADPVNKKLYRRIQKFNSMVQRMEFETKSTHRLQPVLIDSLLKVTFRSRGIELPYEFGVVTNDGKGLLLARSKDQSALMRTPLRANLFPNDVYGNGGTLLVSFPSQARYLFNKIWATLATSVIFILIIIVCFAYAIMIIFRQKKISELKNDFINNMTHEFKTPISTVSLACEALSENEIHSNKNTLMRYLGIIKDETKRLGGQVEKVLQIASLEKQDFALANEIIDMHDLVNKAKERAIIQMETRHGELSCELNASRSLVMGDEFHLTNVIFNLLDNAIKYSPESPEIHIWTKDTANGVNIEVSDKGIGMSRDQVKHIFEKFYRVPTGNRHDVKGFGLGLSYVRFIIEAHGGSITVSSSPGHGSTFNIILPVCNA